MIDLKRRLVKARKYWRLWIFGTIVTLGALFGYLEIQGVQTGHSGDMVCGGDVVCEGIFWISVPPTVTNYLGDVVEIKELCFGTKLNVVLSDSEKISNLGLYKADRRYREDNPSRWRIPWNFTGNCLAVGNHSFLVNATKDEYSIVKWGIDGTKIDPYWYGKGDSYTPCSETHCISGSCTEIYYPNRVFYEENGVWKMINTSFHYNGTHYIADRNNFKVYVKGNMIAIKGENESEVYFKIPAPNPPVVSDNTLIYDISTKGSVKVNGILKIMVTSESIEKVIVIDSLTTNQDSWKYSEEYNDTFSKSRFLVGEPKIWYNNCSGIVVDENTSCADFHYPIVWVKSGNSMEISINKTWLNSAVYPIYIDPTVYYNFTTINMNKAYGDSADGGTVKTAGGAGDFADEDMPTFTEVFTRTVSDFTQAGYVSLQTLDNGFANITSPGSNNEPFGMYNFTINQPKATINWLNVIMSQKEIVNTGSTEHCYYGIVNFTNSDVFDFGAYMDGTTTVTRSYNFTNNAEIQKLINANNQLVMINWGTLSDSGDGCAIDYVGVIVNYNSTVTIVLQTSDSENFEDTYVSSFYGDVNYGTAQEMHIMKAWDTRRVYNKWNVSGIPDGAIILNAENCMYLWDIDGELSVSVHWVNDTAVGPWVEEALIWANQPCGPNFDNSTACNLTVTNYTIYNTEHDESYRCWNTTSLLQTAIDNNMDNFTVAYSATGNAYSNFRSKEIAFPVTMPYLTITYFVPSVEGVCDINITTCTNLNQANKYYCLTTDIIDSSDDNCMPIQATNVTLDCLNHTIDGIDSEYSYGLYTNQEKSTFRDCKITDFWFPVAFASANNGMAYHITINSTAYGIEINDANNNVIDSCHINSTFYGTSFLYTSRGNVINNTAYPLTGRHAIMPRPDVPDDCQNTVENTVGLDGKPIFWHNSSSITIQDWYQNFSQIVLCDADKSIIDNVTMNPSTNQGTSILVVQTDESNFTNIDINNTYRGIVFDYNASNNRIINVTIANTIDGLVIVRSNNTYIFNLTADGNTNWGVFIFVESFYTELYNSTIMNSVFENIRIDDAHYSILKNNTIRDTSRSGIYLLNANHTTIAENVIQDNAALFDAGIFINNAENETIYNNLLNNTDNVDLYGTVYTNYWNTTNQSGVRIYSPASNIGGNYWTNPTSNGYSDTCTDTSPQDGFCDNPWDVENEVQGCTSNNCDYLPYSDEYAVGVPDVNISFGPPETNLLRLDVNDTGAGCGPDYTSIWIEPQNQTDTYGILWLCNNGTLSGNVQAKLTGTPNTGWDIMLTIDNSSSIINALKMTTSYQTIYSNLAQGECIYTWGYANCTQISANPGVSLDFGIT